MATREGRRGRDIGRERRGARSTDRRRIETRTRLLLTGLAASVLSACGGAVGAVPRLERLDPAQGVKMLRPSAAATVCRTTGPFARRDSDPLDAALGELLSRDDEATTVVNGRIESTWWSLGVYGRRCVTLTGDVVRMTTTVLLPMDHAQHQHDGG